MEYDVAIIGGGPGGSSVGTLLKKYHPSAKVVILERERFPREHVGESLLPPVTHVLDEMGCWEKVEEIGFPIKTGALYRWGTSSDVWRFDFLPNEEFEVKPRPAKLDGQRRRVTFHVERSIYDELLLNHTAEMGCEVCQETKVVSIEKEGDRVTALKVEGKNLPKGIGEDGRLRAKHYIDASGHAGILRRGMGVETTEPTSLQNIAIWRYWHKPEWKDIEGVGWGGIRLRVFSICNGWIWFIPISRDRVSVGFVTHQDHYKKSGLRPAELYEEALKQEKNIAALMVDAEPEGGISSTKDWSFLSTRMTGENWMLVGESAGFADPILGGGMALAMVGGTEAAYILKALLTGEHEEKWLKDWYSETQARRISQHIKFADFWYSANAHFSDLKEYTSKIAEEAGLSLNPEEAFRWLATGGFVSDNLAAPVVGTYTLGSVKSAMQIFTGEQAGWEINRYNSFVLNLEGSEPIQHPICREGRIEQVKCFQRGCHLLPMLGIYRLLYRALNKSNDAAAIVAQLRSYIAENPAMTDPYGALLYALEALEGMVAEGWVTASVTDGRPFINVTLDENSSFAFAGS